MRFILCSDGEQFLWKSFWSFRGSFFWQDNARTRAGTKRRALIYIWRAAGEIGTSSFLILKNFSGSVHFPVPILERKRHTLWTDPSCAFDRTEVCLPQNPEDIASVRLNTRMNEPAEHPESSESFFRQFSKADRKIFGYILALVLDVTAAEDIYQETCTILWKEFPRYDPERSFLNWAYGIAFNQIRKYRRTFQNQRLIFSDTLVSALAEDVSAMVEEQSQRQLALTRCMQNLTARERDLLDSYYGDQQTAATLAEQGNCSVHTIYKTIKKLRRALYECVSRRLSSEASS